MSEFDTNRIKVFAATKSLHKISEFNEMLNPRGFLVESAYDQHDIPEVVEDGSTFEENAILKATGVARALNGTVFADDSGLEVDALGGEPGIYSARYAGENATDQDRINKLLRKLSGCCDRRARFVCVIAVASPTGVIGTALGIVEGKIAIEPAGNHGFGYDPVFIPENYGKTMAELSSKEKNAISHRFRALRKIIEKDLLITQE